MTSLARQWREALGAKVEPPPYPSPEKAMGWCLGYDAAIRDLAALAAEGRLPHLERPEASDA